MWQKCPLLAWNAIVRVQLSWRQMFVSQNWIPVIDRDMTLILLFEVEKFRTPRLPSRLIKRIIPHQIQVREFLINASLWIDSIYRFCILQRVMLVLFVFRRGRLRKKTVRSVWIKSMFKIQVRSFITTFHCPWDWPWAHVRTTTCYPCSRCRWGTLYSNTAAHTNCRCWESVLLWVTGSFSRPVTLVPLRVY